MEEPKHLITFYHGDELHEVPKGVTPETTLNQYLREYLHFTGTKRCCLEGGCGACIVVAEHIDPATKKNKIFAVNSCLVSIFSCHNWKIHTLEGIGDPLKGYHPLQKKLAEMNGSQCGYCSGGMIMNMFALQQNNPNLTAQEIEDSFGGNICRCTGYRPILDAWKSFAHDKDNIDFIEWDIEDLTSAACKGKCEDQCQKQCGKPLKFTYGKATWSKVYFLKDLLKTIDPLNEQYMLVAGNTAKGVYKPSKPIDYYIDVTSVQELISWKVTNNDIYFGGNVSLSTAMEVMLDTAGKNGNFSYLTKIVDHLKLVANIPVRNIGTLAGNLMIKYKYRTFPSDIFLILETINAQLIIVDTAGNQAIVSPEQFLRIKMHQKVIKTILIPALDSTYLYGSYKIMDKSQNTLATLNAGYLFKVEQNLVKSCRIVYGGINSDFVHASKTEQYWIGKQLFDNANLLNGYRTLDAELRPDFVEPDFSADYRKQLAISVFYKFILSVAPPNKISSRNKSGATLLERPLSSGKQEYTSIKDRYPLSQPMVKVEALAQTSGQADYIEDIPDLPGQLYCSFVLAKAQPQSTITNVDPSPALALPDVVRYMDKSDIPGKNVWSPTTKSIYFVEEYLFCEGTVLYYDQPVGIIVAKSQELSDKAAELVKITYKESTAKPLLNIKDVLKEPADVQSKRVTHVTEVVRKTQGKDIAKVIDGEFYIGAQYHFHMELQCCNVVPRDDGLDIVTSTQWVDSNQISIAEVLNIKNTQVNIRVKRLGGAFGAKIMRNTPVSCAAALAAYVLRKPVKMRLNLETNMRVLGKRFPLYVKYDAAVNKKGIIQYLDASLYSDFGVGGNEPIDSTLVDMFQNGYVVDTWQFNTYTVQTDTHANCWTRAPGTTEGFAAIEAIMEHIASVMGLDAYDMKLANTNQQKHPKIVDFTKDMLQWADINKRKQAIIAFNDANRWKKRGMSLAPMAWVLGVWANYVAVVSIFHGDGSVAIAHGGIEMGQGINTKVAQVAAYKLGISMDLIQCKPFTTVANPNCTSTGGSLTSEAVCYATMKACEILIDRMAPYKAKLTNPTWAELVKNCFDNWVNLSASTDFSPNKPNIQQYFIYGLCAAETEIDILTGNNMVTRVDIIEDVGDCMNPLVDIGQIEGAFIMGIGYYTQERIVFDAAGQVKTNNTWTYKVPGPKDIPVDFRIKLPGGIPNNVGVLQSKAVAEPPFCLSATVPLAIRNAVGAARKEADSSKPQWYPFDGCSTIENTFINSLNDYMQYKL